MASCRLDGKDRMSRKIEFYFNGKKLIGHDGEPIAVSLWANGFQTIRTCEITGEKRGVFCGIGHCYECRAEVNGITNVRTCLTPNRQGTKVSASGPFHIKETSDHER